MSMVASGQVSSPPINNAEGFRPLVLIHDESGEWLLQIRSRLSELAPRVLEVHSLQDWKSLDLSSEPCPLVLLQLGEHPQTCWSLFERIASQINSTGGLILLLNPQEFPKVRQIARELGATLVIDGSAPPNFVANLLKRWSDIARVREAAAGWREPPALGVDLEEDWRLSLNLDDI